MGPKKEVALSLYRIDRAIAPTDTGTDTGKSGKPGKSGKVLPPDTFIQQYIPDLAYVVPTDYAGTGKVQFDSALDKGIESFLLASRQDDVDTTSVYFDV